MINTAFWQGKRVFITGHTGFKGSWLCIWLHELGAIVQGYSLSVPTTPSLFNEANLDKKFRSEQGDIRDSAHLLACMQHFKPEIVFHLAAQPLVRLSYDLPMETYTTNVIGTVSLFEAVRHTEGVKAVVNVTSDKCYENREWLWGYREDEAMGGFDPYSSSKGCAELITSSYRQSFFNAANYHEHGCAIASARAGNVIGGGDWASDRLIPDILNAFSNRQVVNIRNPNAIRPWQHVLEPLSGYLLLAEKLYTHGIEFSEGWNFGPRENEAQPVQWIVDKLVSQWGDGAHWCNDERSHPHEAHYLKLDCSKARMKLKWQPTWELEHTLNRIVDWHKEWLAGADIYDYTVTEISDFMSASQKLNYRNTHTGDEYVKEHNTSGNSLLGSAICST